MFNMLFGWRKASKCKRLIKRVQCRLKMLKNKRSSIVRQLREDVAHLIKIGREDIAFRRAGHLFEDGTIVTVYELLDNFCEFIIINLPYIRWHKDCPNDVNEAISSIIFASARCGDLPELREIRKLFGERYGQRFEMTALELLPGNLVNRQVKEKLSIYSVPDDVKQKLVDEIARDYCLRPEILLLEYTSKQQEQVKEQDGLEEGSNANDTEGKVIWVDSASISRESTINSCWHQSGDTITTSIGSSTVQQLSPDIKASPMHNKTEKVENFAGQDSPHELETVTFRYKKNQITGRAYATTQEQKQEQKMSTSSSESLPQFPEEMIVYLDDIEEFQSSITKRGSCQDQRIFKFKSPIRPKIGKDEDSCVVNYVDQHESLDESSSSSSSIKRIKTRRKASRNRSVSQEKLSMKDIDTLIYYNKQCKSCPSHRHRSHFHCMHHKRSLVENSERSYNAEKRQNQPHSSHWSNLVAHKCCLNCPCCFCTVDGRNYQEVPPWKQKRGIPTIDGLKEKHSSGNFHHCQCSTIVETETEMERYTFPHKPRRRSCEFGTYLRAMTMPQERSKDSHTDNISRSNSFPNQSPNHVHPKLPDYDDIAAKFLALKKENLRNRHH